MHESELDAQDFRYAIDPETLARFHDAEADISHRTVLDWGEHCTECAAPACYQSCAFFERRADGKCRRFDGGVTTRDNPHALTGLLTGVRVKKWGKWWAPGTLELRPLAEAAAVERRFQRLAGVVRNTPFQNLEVGGRSIGSVLRNRRRSFATRTHQAGPVPSYLLVEVFNPGPHTVGMNIEVSSASDDGRPPLLYRVQVDGFMRIKLAFDKIAAAVDVTRQFNIDLIPATEQGPVDLVFGVTELVHDRNWVADTAPAENSAKRKMIVWDLDDTLWKGVLLEDGLEQLVLNEQAVHAIRELDQRGILHSVASKNTEDDALAALRHFQLEKYFLYPQIHWEPKTGSIRRIAKQMNLGLDSLMFIDDSAFERAQVGEAIPEVMVLADSVIPELLARPEFDVPVTADSRRRREYYRGQLRREIAQDSAGDDYQAFLRHCEITLSIARLTRDSLERAYELAQRTNQMNFSGNRYSMAALQALANDPQRECMVLQCKDRFGEYGIIGFCVYEPGDARMLDLMFSCRIQSKNVDVAFLDWLSRRAADAGHAALSANYRPSPRNRPASRVFETLGFACIEDSDGVQLLQRSLAELPPADDVVVIHDEFR